MQKPTMPQLPTIPRTNIPHMKSSASSSDWAGLPSELLRRIAAEIMSSRDPDWSQTLAARNALRLTCRAWRDDCPVRLRLLNSLFVRKRTAAWWRPQHHTSLQALVAAVTAVRTRVPLPQPEGPRRTGIFVLDSTAAAAVVRSHVSRLSKRARRKLLSEACRCGTESGVKLLSCLGGKYDSPLISTPTPLPSLGNCATISPCMGIRFRCISHQRFRCIVKMSSTVCSNRKS